MAPLLGSIRAGQEQLYLTILRTNLDQTEHFKEKTINLFPAGGAGPGMLHHVSQPTWRIQFIYSEALGMDFRYLTKPQQCQGATHIPALWLC